MWQTLLLKDCFDIPYKESSQWLQKHYQEGVHGNFHKQWIRQQWQKHWSTETWGGTGQRTRLSRL